MKNITFRYKNISWPYLEDEFSDQRKGRGLPLKVN